MGRCRGGESHRLLIAWIDRKGTTANKDTTDRDEEMRFTVRDSPDYYQLKVSIFNDDKKTELIGEAWVDLQDVIKPGGGQSDIWHNLNCKGKYAGEVRLEMTYYDARPKPEKSSEDVSVENALREVSREAKQTPVKRRPLPSDPVSGAASPVEIARAGGPRELGTPGRALPQPVGRSAGNTPSSNRRTVHRDSQPQPVERRPVSQQNYYPETPDDVFGGGQHDAQSYSQPQADSFSQFGGYEPNPPPQQQASHQDFNYQDNPMTGLPELPPMTNHRRQGSNRAQQQDQYRSDYGQPMPPRQPELHHAHSAPQVPVTAPYPEHMMHPRDTFQHTQSDNYMNHGQPVRNEYEDPYQSQQDARYEHDRRSSHQYPGQPQPPQRSPVHEGYDHIPQNSVYRRPSEQYERPSSSHYQLDAPPPPPAHRDSTPGSSSRQDGYSNYAPAPLNFRRSPSPLPSIEQDPYASAQQSYGTPDYAAARRNTAPIDTSPQEPHIYRPRARSGEAMRDSYRPPSRDSRDDYALPPSHPEYYSPTTGQAPDFPPSSQRRDSYQPPYQPATRSPLAVESPHSFGDRSSLPSQANTPSRGREGSDPYHAPLPSRGRPYSNHHYASSEPFVPQSQSYNTPPRQHPLAQQVPSSSPGGYGVHPTPPSQMDTSTGAIVKPIAISPVYTPNSDRHARPAQRSTPTTRKSVSPRPPPSQPSTPSGSNGIFDNPDSFARFNPSAISSTSSLVNHPATSSHGSSPAPVPVTKEGKIVDFHGNHIDPSDRLPEASWAPEPEAKGAVKDYSAARGGRLSGARDLNVTLKPRGASAEPPESVTAGAGGGGGGVIRARLRKKERPASAIVTSGIAGGADRPFRDIPNPAAHSPSSYGYGGGSPGGYAAGGGYASDASPSYGAGHRTSFYGNGNGPAAPSIPPKIPLGGAADGAGGMRGGGGYSPGGYGAAQYGGGRGEDALARELASIDLGPSGGARVARGRMLGFRN